MSIALGAGVCNSAIGDVLLWLNGYIVRKIHVDTMFFVVVKLFWLWGDPPTLKLRRDKSAYTREAMARQVKLVGIG